MSWNISYYTRNMSKFLFFIMIVMSNCRYEVINGFFFEHFHRTHTKSMKFVLLPGMKNLSQLPVFEFLTLAVIFFGVKNWLFKQKPKPICVKKPKIQASKVGRTSRRLSDRSIEDWWKASLIYINFILTRLLFKLQN